MINKIWSIVYNNDKKSLSGLNVTSYKNDTKKYSKNPQSTIKLISNNVESVLQNYGNFCEKTSISASYVANVYRANILIQPNDNIVNYNNLIRYIWQTYGPTDELLSHFNIFMTKDISNNHNSARIWLIGMMCLLEKKKFDECINIFHKYHNNFGTAFVHQYLPLSNFLYKNGIETSRIERSSNIYEIMVKSKNKYMKYIENKSFAVVGNAPSIIGKKFGKDIDSHDVIIRFNNYKIQNYSDDVGIKTNIWARNMLVDETNYAAKRCEYIIFEPNIWRFYIWDKAIENLYNYVTQYCVPVVNLDNRDELVSMLDGFPTTGLLVIHNLFKNRFRLKNVDLYGFTLDQTDNMGIGAHYFNKNDVNLISSLHHNLNKEAKTIKTMLESWNK